MENINNILNSQYLVISVMGPHAGELEGEIFERKIEDITKIGRTFWLNNSKRAEPIMVQRLCDEADKEKKDGYCVFIEACSKKGATPATTCKTARSYSKDNSIWHDLPSGLSPVTGRIGRGVQALVFDQLELVRPACYINLWNYADFFDQDLPLSGSLRIPSVKRMILGQSTVCAIRKDMSNHSDRMVCKPHRKIIAAARLSDPFCVHLR